MSEASLDGIAPLLVRLVGVMTISQHRIQVALNLPDSVPALVIAARVIIEAMTGNPVFPAPVPALAKVASAVEALNEAQVAVLTRARGTAALRDSRLRVLVSLLRRLGAYVQGVADDDPERAVSIIESAGMSVKKKGSASKAPLAVTQGKRSGTAQLAARSAGDRASYEWQYSADGGKTWLPIPRTNQAKTLVTGLPVGTKCLFRLRVLTAKLATNWTDPVPLLVK
jgi:hypothetical protein